MTDEKINALFETAIKAAREPKLPITGFVPGSVGSVSAEVSPARLFEVVCKSEVDAMIASALRARPAPMSAEQVRELVKEQMEGRFVWTGGKFFPCVEKEIQRLILGGVVRHMATLPVSLLPTREDVAAMIDEAYKRNMPAGGIATRPEIVAHINESIMRVMGNVAVETTKERESETIRLVQSLLKVDAEERAKEHAATVERNKRELIGFVRSQVEGQIGDRTVDMITHAEQLINVTVARTIDKKLGMDWKTDWPMWGIFVCLLGGGSYVLMNVVAVVADIVSHMRVAWVN